MRVGTGIRGACSTFVRGRKRRSIYKLYFLIRITRSRLYKVWYRLDERWRVASSRPKHLTVLFLYLSDPKKLLSSTVIGPVGSHILFDVTTRVISVRVIDM